MRRFVSAGSPLARTLALLSVSHLVSAAAQQPWAGGDASSGQLQEITAERLRLIGVATTASEGVVVNEELALTPAYRPGQLLETVPGLDVASHAARAKRTNI